MNARRRTILRQPEHFAVHRADAEESVDFLSGRSGSGRRGRFEASRGTGRLLSRTFTLIELLIVVGIITILAAIAIPNLLEAQTRAKVSRVRADLRTLATAIEAFSGDYGAPPTPRCPVPVSPTK
jgi:prepilin-type N-terminal cleavage/methylation domain-containing protein